jgi:8-oxo-dGTP pyrophosphatase MutT (NUDIX family)
MKQEKSCGAVIMDDLKPDYKLLLIHQVQGHWCLPKGHVEKKETEHETARREIREETGLKVRFLEGFRHTLSYQPEKGVNKEVVYFLAVDEGGKEKIQKEELQGMAWVTPEEADQMITFANDRDLLHAACAFIRTIL